MFRKQSILLVVAALGLALVIAALVTGIRRTADLRDGAVAWQRHTEEVLDTGRSLSDRLRDQEIAQRGFLLTNDPAYGRLARVCQRAAAGDLAALIRLTRDNRSQQASLGELRGMVADRTAQITRTIALAANGRSGEALAYVRSGAGLRSMEAYRAVLDRVLGTERHLLTQRTASVAAGERALRRDLTVLAVVGGGVLLAALVALVLAARQVAAAREKRWQEGQRRADRREEEFRTLADNIPQLAWMADGTGGIYWYNQRWYDYTGTDLAAMRGDGWKTVHDPALVDAVTARFSAALNAGEAWEDTFPLRGADGGYRWFLSRALPIRDGAGRVVRWFGTNTDVTEQRGTERELAEAKVAADAANQAKSQFLANMSHELRTPLNAVIGYSEMLREDAEETGAETIVGDLDKINRAGRTLLSLVNDVLDLSKIEAGKMDLYEEDVDLAGFVADVTGTAQPLIAKNGNRLVVDAPDGAATMRVDVTKLRQIVLNLLSNAAKFTRDATVTLRIAADPDPGSEAGTAGGLVLAVVDQGIGMNEEQLGRLFQAFSQADETTTRNYGGTGLGLALSKTLAELMGGTITVASEPGRGTTFTVRLPVPLRDPAVDDRIGAPAGAGDDGDIVGAATLPSLVAEQLAGSLVLVIDDDPQMHDLMRRLLAREGLAIASASDGETGIAQARALQPAAITLDVTMPGMDGWHVLARLKGDPATSAIPVVMLTMVQDRTMAYALGASDYLSKPVDRERLHEVMERQVGRRDGTVMVVEDDGATRELIRRTLEARGHRVMEAGNGREALDRLSDEGPALVLLDLTMPEMDGFEFLHHLREDERWAQVPVIVMTSKDLSPDERALLSGQVEGVVQKGATSREDLARHVVERIARRRVGGEARSPAAQAEAGAPGSVG